MDDYPHAKEPPPPDAVTRLRTHVQDRLNHLERNGQCPVCNATQWMLLNSTDVASQGTAQLAGWPTYALACGTCGLVRHHLRSIFDGTGSLAYAGEAGTRVAGGDVAASGDPGLAARVAVLERIIASTDDLLAELRWDVKAVRSRLEDDYRALADRISERSDMLSARIGASTFTLYVAGGLAAAVAMGVMAKGFRWF